MPHKHLLIVWWSRTGAAFALAQACEQGMRLAEAQVLVKRADEVVTQDLLNASAYVFVCPENLGSMAGMMKEFFDTQYYAVLDQLNGRPYCAIIAAGSDGTGAARQIERIATGWRLKKVAEPLIATLGAQSAEAILAQKTLSPEILELANQRGRALAEGVLLGVF
jgi:multimeric flavodoxin WrbA